MRLTTRLVPDVVLEAPSEGILGNEVGLGLAFSESNSIVTFDACVGQSLDFRETPLFGH